MTIVSEFERLLPPHKVSLHLTHNDHRAVYQSVAEFVEDDRDAFVSEAEYEKAVATDELWELQWYPDTAVGFHRRMASTLDALMAEYPPRIAELRRDDT